MGFFFFNKYVRMCKRIMEPYLNGNDRMSIEKMRKLYDMMCMLYDEDSICETDFLDLQEKAAEIRTKNHLNMDLRPSYFGKQRGGAFLAEHYDKYGL